MPRPSGRARSSPGSRRAVRSASPGPTGPIGHDQILARLRQAFSSKVFLVARLTDHSLRLSDPAPHVFIPDTHIVPAGDIEDWPGSVLTPSRMDTLAKLLDALDQLQDADPTLTVWQLGDLVDLWRTGSRPGLSLQERLQNLNRSWRPVLRRFFKPDPDRPIRLVFGNHDEDLQQIGLPEREFVPPDPGDTASNDMLVTHGHRFDPIEDLPEALKESFMRGFTQRVTPYAMSFIEATNPHWTPVANKKFTPPPPPAPGDASGFLSHGLQPETPVPLDADRWHVDQVKLEYHPDANPMNIAGGPSRWQDDHSPKLWDRAKARALEAGDAGYAVSLVVVGHTHEPRIILGQQPAGDPIVLMDCGGWIGPAFISPAMNTMVHKCTVGVRVGSDLRIYQLTADPYVWPK